MANWYIQTGSGADRYYYDSAMTVNSINAAGTSANITVTIRVEANWGGYGSYWCCYNRVQLLNGSTSITDQTIYTSGMGNANYVNSTWYWYVVTHDADNTSTGNKANPYGVDGRFFQWTGNVTLSNGAATIYLKHEFKRNGNSATYLPVDTNLTTRHTLNISSYKVTYHANGGTSTPSAVFVKPGSAITLAAGIAHNPTTSSSTLTHTFNGNNGNTPSPSTKTTTKTASTPQNFNGWHEGSETGTSHNASSSFTPTGNITLYAGWSAGTTTYSYSALGTLPTCTRNNTTAAATNRTVTFDANGGSVTPASATSGATITTTYSLKGWYTASSGGSAISTSTAPTANTTYWAQWNSSSSTGAYAAVSLPTPTRTNYRCTGWYTATSGGTLRGAAGGSYTPSASETIHAQWIEVHKLDVNGWLDGASVGNTTNYGTFDVYVGGVKKATGVTDFYQDVDKGASYEIKNITALSGKKYIGVHSGSLTGTMGTANIGVALEFRTLNVWVNVNGTWKHGVIWVNNNGTWKTANVHVNASNTWKQGK